MAQSILAPTTGCIQNSLIEIELLPPDNPDLFVLIRTHQMSPQTMP
ncbi:hypothetical protein OQ252_11585 [Acetobacter farinalis]|uniref:Uncharacterized protein n=1 Tax=Acetobacter farinalis TaxID=1260984 RepID=A0ABT3Q9R2_9PROT|nr:hypothetical protein [Acetobacter farinalis]MCX2562032.1 hypothetical protein [Acetobacter farinalis]NHO30645.1 hypothetical protein [Acetobacter farinalis]